MKKRKDEKGRIIINNLSEIPQGMTEEETGVFWDTHSMPEEMLEATFNSKEDKFEGLIRNMGDVAMEEARKNGTYIVYKDDEGDIVYEYPDGTIRKKKDLPEDESLAKKYDKRLDLPEDKID